MTRDEWLATEAGKDSIKDDCLNNFIHFMDSPMIILFPDNKSSEPLYAKTRIVREHEKELVAAMDPKRIVVYAFTKYDEDSWRFRYAESDIDLS